MRLIKNELRTVMLQERLDNLMMLGIHRDVNKQAGLRHCREQITNLRPGFPCAGLHSSFS